ncbi:outer membrane beta-barrel protein [Flavobacteriaceae bacterium S0825]|uniref:outer membrane beta-barrel protein n=1 Tax=Gaetbulibacter sp. S0825 TaxID=2720084 RepID=UPI0014301965|nr:outer membrane beta-barrel protein [Gaetbulibacter sp. S0825]MCK0108710.1 outer membrane beta-barrel protein [Flavobacteriaceae bacterium S0825]NIX64346.1 outer membrane beta-barrel protein [Gaetbulibacter sp. S0825]
MKQFIFALAFFCAFASYSQSKEFKISGTVISEAESTPLESATVHLERIKDSTLITYTISDKDGKFTLEGKSFDKDLNLFISYVGYRTHKQKIVLDKETITLDDIKLQTDDNALDEVVVTSRAPITVKKDTLEFNVASFKTKRDANVEDLLKQLPGVEIDEAGKITVNGKDVNKILVNGKPFFGNDPAITTKNLTKELISKVQITDTKTKAQAFTGEEGDGENKTINLTIREDKNKGVFGRVSAGAGTDERYEFAGMLNVFDNDQRITVLAGGNNTNSTGFSFGELYRMFGSGGNVSFGGRGFGGGQGQGITTSQNYGANYADEINDKLDISADYFYSGSSTENESATERENILPNRRYFTSSNSNSFRDEKSHRANLEFEVEIDSTLRIDIEPSFNTSNVKREFSDSEESRDDQNVLTNESTSSSFVETVGKDFSNELDITKKFGSNGAFLRLSLDNDYNNTETDDYLNSTTNIYGAIPEDIIRDQFTDGDRTTKGLSTSLTYRLPLKGKEWYMDIRYSFNNNRQENKVSTFDFNNVDQDYTDFNTDLSSDFEYVNRTNTPSISISHRKDKIFTSFETRYIFRNLSNKDFLRPNLSLSRDFEAVEIRSNFRYRFSRTTSLRIGYNLSNNSPNLTQLQPFENVSNPLNTVIGNPNLEPTNNHNVSGRFHSFNVQKGTGIFGFLSANFRNNDIVSKTEIDDNNVRNTTYDNVNGGYNLRSSASYSKSVKIDTVKTFKYRVALSGSMNKNINFNNGEQYASNINLLTPSLELTFDWKDIMQFIPSYNLSFTKRKFDLTAYEDEDFVQHSIGLRTATTVPKKLEWRNDIRFNYNPNIAPGFQKSAWFWNATLAYSVLKDQGAITLKAYDLLNQNTNARRVATANYIQDSQSTVLQRYFMVSFSWKFNSMGPQANQGGRRGSFRMMRH